MTSAEFYLWCLKIERKLNELEKEKELPKDEWGRTLGAFL